MAKIMPFKEGFVRVSPGFEVCTIFANAEVSVAHIKMHKKEVPRYPPKPDEYAVLQTDMYVTVLQGIVQFQEKGSGWETCYTGDKITIPRGTEYAWMIDSATAVLHAVNNPAFKDEDRKA